MTLLFYILTKNVTTLVSTINQELQMLNDWFKCNKLFLNFKKTKYVLFHSKRKRIPANIDSIRIENNVIERTESIHFLGILIHESLEWKHHIANISSKLSRSIGVLSKLRHCFTQEGNGQYFIMLLFYHISTIVMKYGAKHIKSMLINCIFYKNVQYVW